MDVGLGRPLFSQTRRGKRHKSQAAGFAKTRGMLQRHFSMALGASDAQYHFPRRYCRTPRSLQLGAVA
jgi:hypothetical protein